MDVLLHVVGLKKLTARKNTENLIAWIQSIVNHLYWVFTSAI